MIPVVILAVKMYFLDVVYLNGWLWTLIDKVIESRTTIPVLRGFTVACHVLIVTPDLGIISSAGLSGAFFFAAPRILTQKVCDAG